MKEDRRIGDLFSIALKSFAALLAFALLSVYYSDGMAAVRSLPDAYYAESEEELLHKIGCGGSISGVTVTASSSGDERLEYCDRTVEYRLFGVIPLRSVSAYIGKRVYLCPGGQPVGVSIYTKGVLVVGLSSFAAENGKQVSPAAEAGLRAGDVILKADGVEVSSSEQLQQTIDGCSGSVILEAERSGRRIVITVRPVPARESAGQGGGLRIGAWIRDSTVGIGTLTFYDEQSGTVAALGHAVVDADTGSLLKVKSGKLVLADIIGVSRGMQGSPGELHGTFGSGSTVLAEVEANEELGIAGKAEAGLFDNSELVSTAVAFPDEVHTGEAYILASVGGDGVKRYSCRIIKAGSQNEPAQKGLVIQVTDPELIERTGGIVQGMSGSPIIQDDMLVGVVTHVFVNDPLKGYGAYAYWMYRTLCVRR